MKTKIYKTSTVLIIVIANLLISSPIFAQVKTSTKKVRVDQIEKKEISNTSTKKTTFDKTTLVKKALLINGSDTPAYSVGDFIHGGIVFYVDETGEHGLVCAKSDLPPTRWNAGNIVYVQATDDGPYAGEANTAKIIEVQGTVGNPFDIYAALICNELQITDGNKTYDDWYLPSMQELHLMYQNKSIIDTIATANGGAIFEKFHYWSSNDVDSGYAKTYNFMFGEVGNLDVPKRSLTIKVRAVRGF